MTNQLPPKTIYLQWNHSESLDDGIMWCEDKIYEDDIEYRISSYSGAWDDVLKALGGLYEKWARGGGEARETKTALTDLMQAYDKWLD